MIAMILTAAFSGFAGYAALRAFGQSAIFSLVMGCAAVVAAARLLVV